MSIRSTASRVGAAALLVNAVPHGVAGLIGRRFPSPFASPPGVGLSGPLTNLAWSAANAALGTALLRGYDGSRGERAALAASAAGTAVALTAYFGRLDLRVPQTGRRGSGR